MRLKKIGFLVAAFSLTMGMSICARAGTYKLELEATESKPTHYIKYEPGSTEFGKLKGYVQWNDDDDNHKSDYQIDGEYVVVDDNGEPYRLTDGTKVIDFGDALFKNSNPDNVFYTGQKSINWWFATAFRAYDPDKVKVNSGFKSDTLYTTAELERSSSKDIVGVGPNENEKNILRLGPNALSYDFRTESSLDDYTWTEEDADDADDAAKITGSLNLSTEASKKRGDYNTNKEKAYRADLRNGVAGFNISSITKHFNNYDSDSTGTHLSYDKYHRSSGYYIAGTIYRPIVSVNNKDKSFVLERYFAGNQTYYKSWEDALKTTDLYYDKEKSSAYGDWHRLVAAGKKLITSDYDDNDSKYTGACTMAFYVCEGYSINDNMENLYVVYINYMDPFDYCHSLVNILEDQSGEYGRYSAWDGKVLYNILCSFLDLVKYSTG